jgi:hypothetical protein
VLEGAATALWQARNILLADIDKPPRLPASGAER